MRKKFTITQTKHKIARFQQKHHCLRVCLTEIRKNINLTKSQEAQSFQILHNEND